MGVDVVGRAEIAVPQPLLNLLERHVAGQQEAGAGVAQVVEADAAQAVSLQHEAEIARQIFRLHPAAHLVDADVAFVAADVGIPAKPPVFRLLCLEPGQQLANGRGQGQRAPAGLGLGGVPRDDGVLSVHVAAGHRVLNGEGALRKVDGVPLQPEYLAAAQAVEGGQLHRGLDEQPVHGSEQPVDFGPVVEARLKAVLAGPVHFVRGIDRDEVGPHGILERTVQQRVVVNDRVGLHPLHLRGVEVLNLPGGEALERHALLLEPGQNRGAKHPFIGAVGGDGDSAPGDLQPPLQVVRKQLVRGRGGVHCGNLEGLALFRKEGFGLLFVAFHGVTRGNPFGLAFAICVLVTENGIEVAVLLLQVSCDHVVLLLAAQENHPPLACQKDSTFEGGKQYPKAFIPRIPLPARRFPAARLRRSA